MNAEKNTTQTCGGVVITYAPIVSMNDGDLPDACAAQAVLVRGVNV